jgi:hypothetical protein
MRNPFGKAEPPWRWDPQASASEERLTWFLRKNGQQLLPLVDLITQSRVAINE